MSVSPNNISRRTGTNNKPLTSDDDNDGQDEGESVHDGEHTVVSEKKGKDTVLVGLSQHDRRFTQPTPSPFKRAALIAFIVVMFYLAFQMRRSLHQATQNQNIIYAKRYSKEYKFRPAASPIITEYLKDGRIRIRGANPPR